MEMDSGKLFIGGISWDTSEDRLRDYFQTFGQVVEAVIMKDRATGRARGFGFVVFASASVAEIVVKGRHVIDGRTVEAKKAVPRDDHQNFNRSNGGSNQGSPGPARTKKIFVGGLASSVTETDFKTYFDQFGAITDVVVMYDHNTQRPRGFGFITYDSEEAVDRVLFKTFHELNGKMVEVKRAVPKESSPGAARNQSTGYSYGLNRVNSFINTYSPVHNPSSPSGYSMRMEGRFSPAAVGRSGYPPYSPSGFGYGRGMNSYYSGTTDRFGSPIRYNGGAMLNTTNRNLWANSMVSNAFDGGLGSIEEIWGSPPTSSQGAGNASFSSASFGYVIEENNSGGRLSNGRNNGGTIDTPSAYSIPSNILDGGLTNLYKSNHAWQSSLPEHNDSDPFGYELGISADATPGGYSIEGRANRGIAA